MIFFGETKTTVSIDAEIFQSAVKSRHDPLAEARWKVKNGYGKERPRGLQILELTKSQVFQNEVDHHGNMGMHWLQLPLPRELEEVGLFENHTGKACLLGAVYLCGYGEERLCNGKIY